MDKLGWKVDSVETLDFKSEVRLTYKYVVGLDNPTLVWGGCAGAIGNFRYTVLERDVASGFLRRLK
jgi:hypothetical protein